MCLDCMHFRAPHAARQCVCLLMSSANRHISFSTHSWPPYPTLFKQILIVLRKAGPMKTIYGVPPRGHHQGQTRDNSNTRFFTLKRNTYTCVRI